MSLITSVNAELSKEFLKAFGQNPTACVESVVREQQLKVTVIELDATVKVTGQLPDINRINSFITSLSEQYNICPSTGTNSTLKGIETCDISRPVTEHTHSTVEVETGDNIQEKKNVRHCDHTNDVKNIPNTVTCERSQGRRGKLTKSRDTCKTSVNLDALQCAQCLRCFRSHLTFKRHMQSHKIPYSVQCDQCDIQFKDVRRLNVHKKKCIKQKGSITPKRINDILCGLCEQSFIDRIQLRDHILSIHFSSDDINKSKNKLTNLDITCINNKIDDIEDGKHASVDDTLNNEIKAKGARSSSLSCRHCMYVGKTRSNVRDHEHRFHMKLAKKFVCTVCNKAFGYNKDLTRHMVSHKDRQYDCPICGKKYRHECQMREHSRKHDESYIAPRIKCDICPKTFSAKSVLQNHVKAYHMGQRARYLCQTCGKQFTQKRTYHQHLNVHLGIKPFICDICGVPFSYQKSLKDHMLMHSDVRKYECDVCHKRFKQSSGLLTHRKIHKDTRDYSCVYCRREFTQKTSLIRHERIHLGTKPYSCNICHEMFRDVSVVRRHLIMVHKCSPSTWKDDMSRMPSNDATTYFVEPRHQSCNADDIGLLLLNDQTLPVDLLL